LILSDRDIRKQIEPGRLVIEPFDPDMVQPSSVDLRVADEFRVFRNTRYPFIDVRNPMEDLTDVVRVKPEEAFILHPGEFVLGSTLERVSLPGMKIGQLCLFEMTSPAERPYGERGKYQGQRGPTPSKFHQDFKRNSGEGEKPLSEKEGPS
jgi:dCTP deaminase